MSQVNQQDGAPTSLTGLRFLIVSAVVALVVVARFIPHPWNLTPLVAVALFGGAHFLRARSAFIVLLSALLLSDVILYLNTYQAFQQFFMYHLVFNYAAIVLVVALGIWLKSRLTWYNTIGAALAGSLVFFVITNFGSWVWMPEYEKTLSGLMNAYLMGIPFYRNQFVADAIYTFVLFGGFALAERYVAALRREPASVPAGN